MIKLHVKVLGLSRQLILVPSSRQGPSGPSVSSSLLCSPCRVGIFLLLASQIISILAVPSSHYLHTCLSSHLEGGFLWEVPYLSYLCFPRASHIAKA